MDGDSLKNVQPPYFKKSFTVAWFVAAVEGQAGSEEKNRLKIQAACEHEAQSSRALAKKLQLSALRFAKSKTKRADSCPGRQALQPGFQVSTVGWNDVGERKLDSDRETRETEGLRADEQRRVARIRSHDHPADSCTECNRPITSINFMNGPAAVIDSTCVAGMKEAKKRASIEVAPWLTPPSPATTLPPLTTASFFSLMCTAPVSLKLLRIVVVPTLAS